MKKNNKIMKQNKKMVIKMIHKTYQKQKQQKNQMTPEELNIFLNPEEAIKNPQMKQIFLEIQKECQNVEIVIIKEKIIS